MVVKIIKRPTSEDNLFVGKCKKCGTEIECNICDIYFGLTSNLCRRVNSEYCTKCPTCKLSQNIIVKEKCNDLLKPSKVEMDINYKKSYSSWILEFEGYISFNYTLLECKIGYETIYTISSNNLNDKYCAYFTTEISEQKIFGNKKILGRFDSLQDAIEKCNQHYRKIFK